MLFEIMRFYQNLSNKGLDFDKCMAFMSDTTNVMKGVRSGVQINKNRVSTAI